MVKRISYIILAATILATGYIAFRKLNFWDRSVMIFKLNPSEQQYGRGRSGFPGRDFERMEGFAPDREFNPGFDRQARRELPDSIRARSGSGGGRPVMRNRNFPDSLRQQRVRNNPGLDGANGDARMENFQGRRDRGSFEEGFRGGDRGGRGDFRGGRRIYLRNVYWFLAVFAAFTLITLYLDKVYCLLKKRFKGTKA
jgi:hypothetical protein